MSSFLIASATAADYPAFARLVPELGVPEPVPSAERFTEAIAPSALMLRDGDRVAGYAWARPRGDQLHVLHVVTDPEYRRRGVGQALMKEIGRRGRAAGFRRWLLNVKPENVGAQSLYEQFGFRIVFSAVSLRLAWPNLANLPSASDITTELLPSSGDAPVEEAFSLMRGELNSFRTMPGRILLVATRAGSPIGVLAFDPHTSGASPFRVQSPNDARALLEAVRPLALASQDYVRIFVEGDGTLECVLQAAGAVPVLHTLRMEGEIP